MSGDNQVQGAYKTITILEDLAQHEESGVTEIAKRVGGNKSTVYRFLNTLKELGYVYQNEFNEKYSLTLKIFNIGSQVLSKLDIRKAAIPAMEWLAILTKETIHLSCLEDKKLIYLYKIESTQVLRVSMMSRVGQTAPLYCTGVGKALLAWQKPEVIADYIKQEELIRYTPNTIIDQIKLVSELQKIRTQGFSIDDEEHELGVRCVAAPVRDIKGEVIAALSISGPKLRLTDDRIGDMKNLVINAAAKISTYLGYSEND